MAFKGFKSTIRFGLAKSPSKSRQDDPLRGLSTRASVGKMSKRTSALRASRYAAIKRSIRRKVR